MARDLSILKLLPPQALRDDASGDLKNLATAMQATLDKVVGEIDRFVTHFDVDKAQDGTEGSPVGTTSFVDQLLCDMGNPFTFVDAMTTNEKRRVIILLAALYRQKWTCVGVENAIRSLLGYDAQCIVVSEDFPAWQLDVSELGYGSFLYGGDEDLFGFEVWVNKEGALTATELANVREVVLYMKPLEAKLARVIEGVVATKTILFDLEV